MVTWRQAAGRISAEMICPYPPGIPITAPGERLTPEVVDDLQQLAAAGVMVEAADESLAQFRWCGEVGAACVAPGQPPTGSLRRIGAVAQLVRAADS
jgi:hypothetical protein